MVDHTSAKLPTAAAGGLPPGAARPYGALMSHRNRGSINQGIDEDAVGGAQRHQQSRPEHGSDQKAQVPPRRVEAHRARQLFLSDQLVNQHLRGREPYDPGETMNDEQQHGQP